MTCDKCEKECLKQLTCVGDVTDPSETTETAGYDWRREDMTEKVMADIVNVGCIYRSIGNVLYDEPVRRMAEKIVSRFLGEL